MDVLYVLTHLKVLVALNFHKGLFCGWFFITRSVYYFSVFFLLWNSLSDISIEDSSFIFHSGAAKLTGSAPR